MLLIDAHEDLAWNAISFGRDYATSAKDIREKEKGTEVQAMNGLPTLGWQDYKDGGVGIIFATLFAAPTRKRLGEWDNLHYGNPDEAYAVYSAQLEYYHDLTETHPDKFRLILTKADLEQLLSEPENTRPVGIVILMEGAEGIRNAEEIDEWWERGLRIVGTSWIGTRFCGGTHEPGPFTDEGKQFLSDLSKRGFILDCTHMDPPAALEAIDLYDGQIIASHSNAAAITKGETNRQLPDEVIKAIANRGGVIGMVLFNHFIKGSWTPNEGIIYDNVDGSAKEDVTLNDVKKHIDHIAALTGSTDCIGIGSDFDGGFGRDSVPAEIDTIADLQKLAPLLEQSYTKDQTEGAMGGNFLRVLREALPKGS